MTTAAAIDRLVHHSVILELNLPSYRLEASKRQISTHFHEFAFQQQMNLFYRRKHGCAWYPYP